MTETQPEPIEEPAPIEEPTPEPEPDETEAEPEPEPEPDDEPAQQPQSRAVTPEEIEKRAGQSRRAFEAFGRKLFAIHDDYAHDLVECPLCPDLHKGFLNIHDAGRVPEEIKLAVMQFLGFAREIEYSQLPGFRACPTCGGEGKGLTGSQVPDKRVATCPDCKGFGYKGPEVAQGNGHVEHDPALTGPTVLGLEAPTDEVDEWQEPRILPDGRENPNFGKMPHRKVLVEPWGQTAGLTAQDAVTA